LSGNKRKESKTMEKLLLQGAMEIETDYLIQRLKEAKDYRVLVEEGMTVHAARLGQTEILVQTTGMGTVKAAMATSLALMKWKPTGVINQGTAGSQTRKLERGHVVLGTQAVNINALKMPKKEEGRGSDPFSWEGFHTTYYATDSELRQMFVDNPYRDGDFVEGKIATGDVYSREADRILWLSKTYKTLCEDMETAAVLEVCHHYKVPCAALRIMSNNELLDQDFSEETAGKLQKYIWQVLVKTYLQKGTEH